MIHERKNGISCADGVEPVFDDKVSHDVVERCPNGKIKGRSTAPVYVIIRINLDGVDTDADVLGYSYGPDYGCPFMETVAARDAFGKFWNYKDGSPCFDPIKDDGSERPLPTDRFLMWDEIEEDYDGIPSVTIGSLTIYEAKAEGDSEIARKPIRRYKMMQAQPSLNDFMSIETEGDRKFLQGRTCRRILSRGVLSWLERDEGRSCDRSTWIVSDPYPEFRF